MANYKETIDSKPLQRTAKGLAYEAMRKSISDNIENGIAGILSPKELEEFRELNAEVLRVKDVRPGAVHQTQIMTTMSVMYANDEFIGSRLMPVISTNGSLSGMFYSYDQRDRLSYPDSSMGNRSDPAELSEGRTKTAFGLSVDSLKEYVDQMTVQNQDAPLNELLDAQANVLNGLEFNREIAISAIINTGANYSGNTVAIAAGDRFDTASGGDPGSVVDTAKAAIWSGSGPGKMVLATSLTTYNVLKRHPRILDQIKYGGVSGAQFASRQALADFFEVDEVLVTNARKDTANIGQASATFANIWADSIAILRVSTSPSPRNACFGYTFQDAPNQTDLMFDLSRGSKGSYMARCSRASVSKVVAGLSGYLITTPIG